LNKSTSLEKRTLENPKAFFSSPKSSSLPLIRESFRLNETRNESISQLASASALMKCRRNERRKRFAPSSPNEDERLQISGLHAVVVCLLLGAVVLVVGLVQLAPGATTTNHRMALLVAGAALLILGELSYT